MGQKKGFSHWARKLSQDQVRSVFCRYWAGESQGDLAREYGVAQATVFRIVHRQLYVPETEDLAGDMKPDRKQTRKKRSAV